MSESRNVVIVTGIPGVGKTTVINAAVDLVKEKHSEEVLILNFGTEMFEVASKAGDVKDRDEMRKLPTGKQRSSMTSSTGGWRRQGGSDKYISAYLYCNY